MLERIVMNAKLLYAATVGLALISPLAVADDTAAAANPVSIDSQKAVGAATLHHSDYDDELAARPTPGSQMKRDAVVAALKTPADRRLVGPLRSKTYNAYGTEIMRGPAYSRAEIKSEVLEARAQHALRPAGEAVDQPDAAAPGRDASSFAMRRVRRSGG
jgi:hypothetical protein